MGEGIKARAAAIETMLRIAFYGSPAARERAIKYLRSVGVVITRSV